MSGSGALDEHIVGPIVGIGCSASLPSCGFSLTTARTRVESGQRRVSGQNRLCRRDDCDDTPLILRSGAKRRVSKDGPEIANRSLCCRMAKAAIGKSISAFVSAADGPRDESTAHGTQDSRGDSQRSHVPCHLTWLEIFRPAGSIPKGLCSGRTRA
jgi:hypothetical protein